MALPLPTPEQLFPAGGQLIRGLNALNDYAQNRSAAEYAPYTNYANAASKIAYSNFVGPQAIASILNNPATRGMFMPQQYNELAKAFSQQVSGPANALANLPKPQGGGGFGGILAPLVNKFMSTIGVNNTPSLAPQNALLQQPQTAQVSQSQQAPQQNYDFGSSYDSKGNNIPASDEEILNVVRNGNQSGANVTPGGSPTYERLSKNIPAGTFGAQSPGAIISTGEKAMTAQAETEAKNIANQWQKRQDEMKDQVEGAQEVLNNAARMENAYPNLMRAERGYGLGSLPAVSGAAQEVDQAATNMMINKIKQWQSSRITNMDLKVGPLQKPGRYMNTDEFNKSMEYEKGLSQRMLEYPAAALKAQQMGLNPAQFDAVWARYANEQPFFNPKTGKRDHNNLNTWGNYLTQNSLEETFSPKFKKQMDKYEKNMVGGDEKEDKQINKKFKDNIIDIPKFKSKKEFQDWYRSQPKAIQDAVKLKLGQ